MECYWGAVRRILEVFEGTSVGRAKLCGRKWRAMNVDDVYR